MLIWLIIFAVFALLGVGSYYKGAIRSLVSLVGLLVALFLTMPLAPFLEPLVPKVGLEHPLWTVIVPPLAVFLTIVLVFVGVGMFVHHKVAVHFKYAADDYTRIQWVRLNQRLGLTVGFAAAAIYSVLIGLVIYIFGYPVIAVTGEESPTAQRLLANARADLHSSGLDKSLASLDPMGENYYLTSDIFGLLYRNGIALQERLFNYPAFLALGERQEFRDIATDTELQQLLQTAGPAIDIIKNPKILAVVNNAEIVEALRQVDLKDLYSYLRTGRSAKYAEEKILGRWHVDPSATLVLAKRKNPDMPVSEMAAMKRLVAIFLPKMAFMATPDSQALVRMELTDEAKRIIETRDAAVRAAAEVATDGTAQGPTAAAQAARYGFRPPNARVPVGPAPQATRPIPPADAIPDFNFSSTGTWARDGIKYKLSLKAEQGEGHAAEASVDEDRMLLSMRGRTFVFVR